MKITMEDFINEEIAVRTGTGENLKKFLQMCEERGLRWVSGADATKYEPSEYGDDYCITYGDCVYGRLEFGSATHCRAKRHLMVVDFTDLVSKSPKQDNTLDALTKVREYIDKLIKEREA